MDTEKSSIEKQPTAEGGIEAPERDAGIEEGLARLDDLSGQIDNLAEEIVDRSEEVSEQGTVVLRGADNGSDDTKRLAEIKRKAIDIHSGAETFIKGALLSLEVNSLPSQLSKVESSVEGRNIEESELSDNIISKIATTLTKRAEGTDLSMDREMDEDERIELQMEIEAIKESLSYLAREGAGAEKALHRLAGSLQVSRNKAEIAMGPPSEANKEALLAEFMILKERKSQKMVPFESYIIPGKKYYEKIKILNGRGEVEEVGYDEASIRHMARDAEGNKIEEIQVFISDQDKKAIDEKTEELDNARRREATTPEFKERQNKKIKNLIELQKIVSETQKMLKKIDKAWKVGLMSAIDDLGLTRDQAVILKGNIERQKQKFYRYELVKASRKQLENPRDDVVEFIKNAQAV